MYVKLDLNQGELYFMTPGMDDFALAGYTWSISVPYHLFVSLYYERSSVTVTRLPVNSILESCGPISNFDKIQ